MINTPTRTNEEYVQVPLQVYQAVLRELEECRKVLDRQQPMPGVKLPEREVAIGREPATARYEAWLR